MMKRNYPVFPTGRPELRVNVRTTNGGFPVSRSPLKSSRLTVEQRGMATRSAKAAKITLPILNLNKED